MNKMEQVIEQIEVLCKKRVAEGRMSKVPANTEIRVAVEIVTDEFKEEGYKKVSMKVFTIRTLNWLEYIDTMRFFENLVVSDEEEAM
jgi:hypothetical protein